MVHPSPHAAQTLPSGTVTFLFTDIEGSTQLWQQHPAAMPAALTRHHTILHRAIASHDGYVFQIIGDAFCAAFATAFDGLIAALAAQRALRDEAWGDTGPLRVRMALHTGVAQVHAGDYTAGQYVSGLTLSRAARLLSAGHGGQILVSSPTAELVSEQMPPDTVLRDMGVHRLKDLVQPQHIFQVSASDLSTHFPPLKTLGALPNNLPIHLTSFIGREHELAEMHGLLSTTRLLTLTGPGGAGKTRLALQVAADRLNAFEHGVWFVELASLSEPTLVPKAVLNTLGLREEAGHELLAPLTDFLRAKSLLLVLDNCEHLIHTCAHLAHHLLTHTLHLKILATSREALGIAGEVPYQVPSLALPDPQHLPPLASLTQYDAVHLFIERATAVQPTFALMHANAPAVAHICHRLDGIPLAIELAAARIKLFTPEQIVARLDDRFRLLTGGSRTALPRQQTLRSTIDWSDSLLSDAERILFRRLAVFAGGWTFDAAEAVCVNDGLDAFEMLDLLAQLVNKSLVTTEVHEGETRYRMLDTIRDYALDKLRDAGEVGQVRDRHLEYFLALAETAEPQLRSGEQIVWLHRLETELDNVRGALDWCMKQPARAGVGLRLVGTLAWFWELRGYPNEGRQRLETALANASGSVPPVLRAKALNGAGRLAFVQDDLATAQVLLEESVRLADHVSDQWLMLAARHNLANVLAMRGEPEAARALHAASLELGKAIGDAWGMAWALMGLGRMALATGEYDAARAYFEESLVLRRGMHDQWGIARSLNELGDVARMQGDYGTARARYEASLTIHQELGHTEFMTRVLPNLAHVVHQLGADDEAAVLFRQGLQLCQALGKRHRLGECLVGLATIASARGQLDKAVQLLAAFERLIVSTRLGLSPDKAVAVEQLKQVLRAALAVDSYAIAWDKGGALTQEQAVALALQEES